MKILHVYKTYYPDTFGGVEKVINQLIHSVTQYGVHSEVMTLSTRPSATPILIDGHRVHQFKSNFQIASTDFSLAALRSFSDITKEADIIHYHYPWPYMDVLHCFSNIKKPTVLTYHSDIIRQKMLSKFYHPLKHHFLRQMDAIVSTSPNYLRTSPDLTTYQHKTTVIPIGLDKSSYPIPSPSTLEKWRSTLPPRFFLFVGVLRYYKGLHVLLNALQHIQVPVVIAGAGPMENELKALAKKNNLSSVYFVGEISEEDKAALFTLAYSILFPSHLRSEAFGISLLEGAMYGKALISCEIGTGTTYINLDQQTGLAVKPECPIELANAMRYLWENESIAHQMGEKAKHRYETFFTADEMGKGYYQVYQDVLS